MERTTITIEIKQEVSIFLVWLVSGIVFVSVAFFIPSPSMELWPQFYAAGIAAIMYLIALLIYAVRKPVSMKARVIAIACFVIILGTIISLSIIADVRTQRQAQFMIKSWSMNERHKMINIMTQSFLKTLQVFHQQGSVKKETLAQVFQKLNDNASVGSNINKKPDYKGDSLKTYIQVLKPDRVELVSQEVYYKGRNQQFINYNGQKGMIQERCILTARGITYESEN
jgi:hypothetical protein